MLQVTNEELKDRQL